MGFEQNPMIKIVGVSQTRLKGGLAMVFKVLYGNEFKEDLKADY